MNNIDNRLKKYFNSLPFSFYAVVNEIEAHGQHHGELMRYVNYLLDDSAIPNNVCEAFKPADMALNINWDAIAAHYKLLFFKKGVSDRSVNQNILDNYHENDFDRISELNKEPNSTIRLQLKDEIITELVRAYVEGIAAAEEANTRTGLPEKDTGLILLAEEYKKNGCINARVKKRLFPLRDNEPFVTFFMLVTDNDILIADYGVKSFALLNDLNFRLVVYCNWIKPANREKYFPKWRNTYPFLEIHEPEWMTEHNRPSGTSYYGYGADGPYERNEVLWDCELPKFKSRYYATVDADFEILQPEFMHLMLEQSENSATAGFIGSNMTKESYFTDQNHPEPGKSIQHTVVNTWCCIYKRETLVCKVSHLVYEEQNREDKRSNLWDSSGIKQLALKYIHGYGGSNVHPGYQTQFIHYGAFSHNKHLDEKNIEMWRQLMILRKIGFEKVLGPKLYLEYKTHLTQLLRKMGAELSGSENVSQLAAETYRLIFQHVDNSNPWKSSFQEMHR